MGQFQSLNAAEKVVIEETDLLGNDTKRDGILQDRPKTGRLIDIPAIFFDQTLDKLVQVTSGRARSCEREESRKREVFGALLFDLGQLCQREVVG